MSGKILRNIEMTLDPKSIQNAIREIMDFKEQLRQSMQELVEVLMEDGVEIAKMQLVSMDGVYTGALESSIDHGKFDPKTRSGYVFAGNSSTPYAIFVEYGTGMIGAESPHPEPNGWEYDANGHGDKGWVYKNDNDGKFHWTRGYVSRPFMYNTLKWLEEAAPDRMSKKLTEM